LVAVLALLVWLFSTRLLTLAGGFLVEDDGPRKADAVVVLGGDEFGSRIVKGAELAKAGYAPYVLVSGPESLLGHDSDTTIEFARRKGFSTALFRAMPLPPEANSTQSEAVYLGKYLKQNGVKTILLVTSNFHTRRAARLWRTENPWLDVAVEAAPDRFFTPETWWKSRPGKKTFLYEWLKTATTWAGS
jgi:uncharacterized SAM-binding protein YcdF (DUF218 family)